MGLFLTRGGISCSYALMTHLLPAQAYGQTGSGKTYTMGTACNSREFLASEPAGVVPKTLMVLFSYIGLASQTYDVTLKVREF